VTDIDDDYDDQDDDYDQREPDPPWDSPDPWDWHPSLRDRTRWRISGWKRRVRVILRRERYSDEPPF